MLSTSPLLHSPFPHWHSLFPPQKVQFMVASLGNGSTVSQKTCSLTPLSTRGDDSELCPWHCCYNVFGTLEFLNDFGALWCDVEIISVSPGGGDTGREMQAVTQSDYAPALPAQVLSQKLVIASTGKALPRPWPWAVYLQWLCSEKRTSPRALTEGHCLALKVTETC